MNRIKFLIVSVVVMATVLFEILVFLNLQVSEFPYTTTNVCKYSQFETSKEVTAEMVSPESFLLVRENQQGYSSEIIVGNKETPPLSWDGDSYYHLTETVIPKGVWKIMPCELLKIRFTEAIPGATVTFKMSLFNKILSGFLIALVAIIIIEVIIAEGKKKKTEM